MISQARDIYGLGYKNIQVSMGVQAMLLGQVGLHKESLGLLRYLDEEHAAHASMKDSKVIP